MSWIDIGILSLLAAWIFLALRHERKMKRKGGCEFCGFSSCPFRSRE